MAAKTSKSKATPTGKPLVIVESPAKARTIEKFLGGEYEVQASIGHVRDLPSSGTPLPARWKGHKHARLGVDLDNDFEPMYVVPTTKKEQISRLKRLLADAPELLLATDEDREGESISWHLVEVLKPAVPVKRLVFHEITKTAIEHALDTAREINQDLVRAQETRRILDRLFGYEVSPVLWRKIRRGLSAGRVQSVALRLLVERERERIAFHESVWWDLAGAFAPAGRPKEDFEAMLTRLGGKRVASGRHFDPATGALTDKAKDEGVVVLDEAAASKLKADLEQGPAEVASVEEKPYTQRPAAPFTTSTLQQEAGRKLRFSAKRTMALAQRLYENGHITYMRTDSTALSGEAIGAARTLIAAQYGERYLPASPRVYKTKVKNAQEAHEAIRPAGTSFASIEDVRRQSDGDAARLYELIWKRTVASQMTNATGKRVTIRVAVGEAIFRASGKTIEFPGFQRAYVEGSDDPRAELSEQERILPTLAEGDAVDVRSLEAKHHVTQPPARYTEASLVKELDQRGIGRPSTWASIIGVLLDREYAFRKGSALVPSFAAFAVVRMLKRHFGQVLDYDFTASMEDELDAIARGELGSRAYLRRFYTGNGSPGLKDLVERGLEEVDPREVCGIDLGTTDDGRAVQMRVGKYGLFVTDGESNASVVNDIIPDEMTLEKAVALIAEAAKGPQALGDHPETGQKVYVRSGRFGPYVQLGEVPEDGGEKPKTASLLEGMTPETLDLATALRLLELPRDLGPHPDNEAPDGDHVTAQVGRYGPYVKWGSESRSIPSDISPLDITLAQAVELLKQPRRRRGQAAPKPPLRTVGKHPESGAELQLKDGRFGPYVTDGSINASLPKSTNPDDLTLEEAVELLARRAERIAAGGGRRKKKKAARKKKATRKKKASKKKAAKRKATKKKATKKSAASKPAGDADA